MLATQANVSAQGLTNAFVTSSPDPPGCCARLVGMVSRTNILPDVGHISTEKSATTPWAYQKFSSADAEGPLHLKTQHKEAQTGTKQSGTGPKGWKRKVIQTHHQCTQQEHGGKTFPSPILQNITKP